MFAGIVAAVAALVAAQNTQASHSSDCTSLADRLRSPSESARLAIGGAELTLACADAACLSAQPQIALLCRQRRQLLAPGPNTPRSLAPGCDGDAVCPRCQPMAHTAHNTSWAIGTAHAWIDQNTRRWNATVRTSLKNIISTAFDSHLIDGAALASLTRSDLQQMGVPTGAQIYLLSQIEENALAISPNLAPNLDQCSVHYGQDMKLYVDFHLVKVTDIDEARFEFTVLYWWLESWREDRHRYIPDMSIEQARTCQNRIARIAGAGIEPSNKCADDLWGQTPDAPAGRGRFEMNKGSFEVLQDIPITFFGEALFDDAATHMMLVRATFLTEMNHEDFPS